jgi:hypothetical protein
MGDGAPSSPRLAVCPPACDNVRMINDSIFPYSLEVTPCDKRAGHFQWAIRERGRLLQRSDRPHLSESKALENGHEQIQRLLHGARDRR